MLKKRYGIYVNKYNLCHREVVVVFVIFLLFPNREKTKFERFSGTIFTLS